MARFRLLCFVTQSLLLAAMTAAQTTPQAPAAVQAPPAAPATPAPTNSLRVIVLDPGHGGTDTGARGSGSLNEKDVALSIAKTLRAELAKQGFEVVLTREGNENPSFDDRAALANAQRAGVFVSLHIASTGRVGSVRAYYFARSAGAAGARERPALVRWDEAQIPHIEQSRRLAELLQVQLGLKFKGSPEVPVAAAVLQLRSINAPAIAVEISSVAAQNRGALEALAADLAAALARAVNAFRPLYTPGSN